MNLAIKKRLISIWRLSQAVKLVFTRKRDKPITMRHEDGRRGLLAFASRLPHNTVLVEIGSYRGESAEIFLSSGNISHIYCVDPWESMYDLSDKASYTNMTLVENEFDQRFKHDDRVTKVKGTIDTLSEMIERGEIAEKTIDVVYIDGCHTYDAVKHDISVALKKIKPKYAIAGHDYGWPGIHDAIAESLGAVDETYSDSSWLKTLV